ncbi:hypothetical protein AAC387_Pa12g0946 [Persea americana]
MPIVTGIGEGNRYRFCTAIMPRRKSPETLFPVFTTSCPSASALSEKTTQEKQRQGNLYCCSETYLGYWDRTVPKKKTRAVPPQPELVAAAAFRCLSLASEKGRRISPVAKSIFCSRD